MPLCGCLGSCCKKKKVTNYKISFHEEKISTEATVNEGYETDDQGQEGKDSEPPRKEYFLWKTVLEELKGKYGESKTSDDDDSGSMSWVLKVLKPVNTIKPEPKKSDAIYVAVIKIKEETAEAPREIENEQDLIAEPETMDNRVPAIGKAAPAFKGTAVVKGEFKDISLAEYKGKYVVLFFYPLDFTFVCPTEIIAFSERAEEFRNIGCELIAVSTDSHFSHLAWINTDRKNGGLGQMDIPLLADKNMKISKSYGVLKEDDGIAYRGLFIIDTQQQLRQITMNDLPVGRDVDETLRLVQAFQFTDKHGEVCPAGWKPGAKTMKADPKGSKAYFASQN